MTTGGQGPRSGSGVRMSRRALVLGGAGLVAGVLGHGLLKERGQSSAVFIASGQRYDEGLEQTLRDGLTAVGLSPNRVRGKRVLLKPNLVEPLHTAPHVTTHPSVVRAVAEVFRGWGALVRVGEGPGHVRDTEMALAESGLDDVLRADGLPFADLNYDDVKVVSNRGRTTPLRAFSLPRSALDVDLLISLPKLKTHHWTGMTASMKNLFGVLPGIIYGWPKNILHYTGIHPAVFDLCASLPPTLAIVDAIDCMEGDGPILGSCKPMGLLIVGKSLPAVDATCARLMGLNPARIGYLRLAAAKLGSIDDNHIYQRGETWQRLASPFELLDYPHLLKLRDPNPGEEQDLQRTGARPSPITG